MVKRLLLRLGYGALGAAYVALGVAAVQIAIAGSRDRINGFAGALRNLLARPYGATVVSGIAAGLAAFVLARTLDAADRRRGTLFRAVAAADALAHAGLAWAAASLALGIRGRRSSARPALAWLLSQTWGPTALTAAAIAVFAIGAFQLWQGLTGNPRRQLSQRPLGPAAPYAIRIGRFGLFVRGIVTVIIAWFLVETALDADPRKFHEIGGALEVLRGMPAGGLLLGVAGGGLAAYGCYLVLLGFFRRAR
jgi:Domain of Unknown Function (DUF1206)